MPSIKNLIKRIKEKKELSGLSDQVVEDEISTYKKQYSMSLENITERNTKIIVSEIRARLRRITGQYQKSLKNKENIPYSEVLKSHSSTIERLSFYPKLKKIIAKTKPKSILDLGCGVNPLALATKKIRYYASDIKEDELLIIKKFFKEKNINGETFVYDLRKISPGLPTTDLCLIFKVIDILSDSTKERNILAEKIISLVPAKHIIISFATKKISGRSMNHPQRKWFEAILKKHNLKFEKFSSNNEIFYLTL